MSGTTSHEEGFSDGIAIEGDGIEDSMDGGKDVFFRDERGLGADFEGAVFMFADEGEELDDIAEFFGETDVEGGDFFNATDVDLFGIDEKAVGE